LTKHPSTKPMLNLHTHHPTGDPALREITNHAYGKALPEAATWRSAGLHPWYIDDIDWVEAERWLRAEAAKPEVKAIGEAGLDKVTATPWAVQERAFRLCLAVAAEMEKPVIVHCVRAYAETLQVLAEFSGRLPLVIFHGFDKHPQVARMVFSAGYCISFGTALLHPQSHAAEALREAPAARFFLETDDRPDVSIRDIYVRATAIRGVADDGAAFFTQI
jgi:TatD DNase family protein